jgi:hypothetical protein
MHQIITLAEEASGNSLGFPTFVTGVIAMAIFILLGVVTWSYRDVANRHDHKSSNDSHH